jgi:predicted O-linked N-acetylglucosamine transferase (SPINDLY family)
MATIDDALTLALQHHRAGRLDEAVAAYRQALALQPAYAEAYNNLGCALHAQGHLEEAVAAYRQALALRPAYAEAHYNLGNALQAQSRLEEAVASFRQALIHKPAFAEACNNLGNILQEQGKLEEAVAAYRQAARHRPSYPEAHNNLGCALQAQGRLEEAVAAYRQAVALKPAYAEAYNNLGLARQEQGRLEEAVAAYRQAVRLRPGYPEAHNNLGTALQVQGKVEEAVAAYREALALKPAYAEAESQLMHQLQHLCDWSQLEELFEHQKQLLRATPPAIGPPFTFLSIPSTPADQLACARNWTMNIFHPYAQQHEGMGFHFARASRPRLRIGYLSADFHQHATAYLIAELFELHDRSRVEVCAYSYGPDDGSEMRRRLVRACDRFEDVTTAAYQEAARRIYDDGIDILVDLKGYTKSARTQVVALRPAPIQVNYLGYPGTMGADFIDYIITDRFITPPGQEPFFSEQFVYLPDCYQINDRKRKIVDQTPARTECGLSQDGFVFCCFNNTYKITPAVFGVWMRLLQVVPGSLLWLLEFSRGAAANLRREASARGVNPERLVFAPLIPIEQHLARLRLADLFLDTLPYNAHTTTSDALWAGLPVLTCAGETFASRIAGSLLTAIGLPELITYSLEEYEARALYLARNPAELACLRERLAKNRLTAPLFDSERFTRHLECAYQMIWDIYMRGETPRRIEVPAF